MKFAKLTAVFAASFMLWACAQTPTPNVATNNNASLPASASPQPEVTPEQDELARGRKIYMASCAACHKESGKGGKIEIDGKTINADDLTSAKIKGFSNDKITGYVYNGIEDEGMPAFKDKLTEAEIREVVRYVRTGIQKMPAVGDAKPQASPQ